MIRHGFAPYLECSSKGDKRFSAFYARIKSRGNKSIEELYQATKVFENGVTGLSPKEAKGKQALNMEECASMYAILWDEYFEENPELYHIISQYEGFSDMFGQAGHQCQATEIYRIWVKFQLKNQAKIMDQFKHLVVNKYRTDVYDTYCGRGSPFGNEYSHLSTSKAKYQVNTVEQAIAHHRFSLIKRCKIDPEYKQKVKELNGKVLACYCSMPFSPQPCHCFTLAAAAHTFVLYPNL